MIFKNRIYVLIYEEFNEELKFGQLLLNQLFYIKKVTEYLSSNYFSAQNSFHSIMSVLPTFSPEIKCELKYGDKCQVHENSFHIISFMIILNY